MQVCRAIPTHNTDRRRLHYGLDFICLLSGAACGLPAWREDQRRYSGICGRGVGTMLAPVHEKVGFGGHDGRFETSVHENGRFCGYKWVTTYKITTYEEGF